MHITSFSASAALVFEGCEARFLAEYGADRANRVTHTSASLGTACHGAIQDWVEFGYHLEPPETPERAIELLYGAHYERVFSDHSRYDEGLAMVLRWLERCDLKYWTNREVISTEVKDSFPITARINDAAAVEIPFNYIWDRCDKVHRDDGGYDIEVVDYKSWREATNPDQLRAKIQTRLYAAAAHRRFPEAKRIWVTLDLLRYDGPVSAVFRASEAETIELYLQRLIQRVIDSDGTEETLNKDCPYCVRKLQCKALSTNQVVGGTLGTLSDPIKAGVLREKIAFRIKGLEALVEELDQFIVNDLRQRDVVSLQNDDGVRVKLNMSKRRGIDQRRLAEVVGEDIFSRYGKMNLGDIDELLKGHEITVGQKNEIRNLIYTNYGEPKPEIVLPSVD